MISRLYSSVFSEFKSQFRRFQRVLYYIPLAWFLFLFLIPILIIFVISLTEPAIQVPPFYYPFHYNQNGMTIRLYIANFTTILTDFFYIKSLLKSFELACLSMVSCGIIGYALSYSLLKIPVYLRFTILLMIVIPFWTSFIVRIYAWMGLLSQNGLINQWLLKLHLIAKPIQFLGSDFAVWIGMTYCYLPFMIFPIYSSLHKIPSEYIEASYNLGCSPWKSFWLITFPLSKPGIRAGCLFVFLPTIGEFVIPELLGGSDTMTIGRVIWIEFFNNRNWPLACSIASILLLFFLILVWLFRKKEKEL
jgi:putrescine transport system permease protein